MVDTDNAQFESSLKEWHPDVAARWTHALGDWDVAVGYFRGTSREPRFTLDVRNDGEPRLIPVYDQIDQAGLELQWTVEAWLWKLEAMTRWGHGKRFEAVVAGFEYSFFSLFGTALDLGLVAEYLYDGRSTAAPGTPFENDVFVGGRLAFNDVGSTSILAGAIVDDQTGATLRHHRGQPPPRGPLDHRVGSRGLFRRSVNGPPLRRTPGRLRTASAVLVFLSAAAWDWQGGRLLK